MVATSNRQIGLATCWVHRHIFRRSDSRDVCSLLLSVRAKRWLPLRSRHGLAGFGCGGVVGMGGPRPRSGTSDLWSDLMSFALFASSISHASRPAKCASPTLPGIRFVAHSCLPLGSSRRIGGIAASLRKLLSRAKGNLMGRDGNGPAATAPLHPNAGTSGHREIAERKSNQR